jgi:leader peptidase (prepilin peptidase)/N-methyltransferase
LPISVVYPAVELAAGISLLSLFIGHWPDLNPEFAYKAVLIFGLIAIITSDVLYFIIPDKIVFPLIIIGFIRIFQFHGDAVYNLLLSAFVFFSFFAIIYLASKGKWMGFGDAKLSFLLGLWLGYPLGFWAIAVSVWVAALLGLVLVAFGRANMSTKLPFGSFIGVVFIIFIIFNNAIQTYFPWFSWIF